MPRANDNDSDKIKNDLDRNFPNLSSSQSQGELSVYEIDILSYGNSNSTGKSKKLSTCQKDNKWKVEFNESELVIENESLQVEEKVPNGRIPFNPLIESHYPLLNPLKVEPDFNSVSFEASSEEKSSADGKHHKFSITEKSVDKQCPSFNSNASEERFKSQLRKIIIENFVSENDDKIQSLVKNLKQLENEPVHLHHHEHHHHHYYINSSKAQSIKNFLKIIPTNTNSQDSTKADEITGEKTSQQQENADKCTENIPNTAAPYVPDEPANLSYTKINSPDLESCNALSPGQKNSHGNLPISSSIDSFLGKKSDFVTAHTFSEADVSKCGSDQTSFVSDAYKKTSLEPKTKDIPKLTPKKLLKPEYTELMESLKVLDKYLEPKVITETKARVSYLKCECTSENENEVAGMEKQSSEVELGTFPEQKKCPKVSSSQSTMKTDSGKNRCASHFSAKRSNESKEVKTISHHVWTKHLKQELKDIKERVENLEKLYLKKKKWLALNLRGFDPKLTSKREISVFSTKTYIMRADNKFFRESPPCWV